jgi:pilus assembly protein Flp/PilA
MDRSQHVDRSAEDLRRAHGDRGASLVEYALLLALIAVVCIGAVTFFGTANKDSLSQSGQSISAAN